MNSKKAVLAFALISSMAVFGANSAGAEEMTVEPWFVEGYNQAEMILEPGTTAYCNKDFTVHNMSESEEAHVQIIRGNGDNYDWDQIEPNKALGYKKDGVSIFSSDSGARQHVDETRIVNGTMGSANLKVLCK
ncbi:exported hypothetical protein [Nitrospina gracilis 3/211]|uniref:Uncharacterized protein n=1 Tax=Nitrospina gracilis (strain 3/211) TaxID=1266370 RepID=M1YV86_NITG3|nr:MULTISPECIES: hypothetical protein [Nitrospina]MCF8722213.1 hypothetical protein [Nitrospina sp. Nb-3]CCQ89408.1 exported hypothetical protein [Nitrospina gracilis 3/211]